MNFSTPVKVKSVLELNTKVESYVIIHMLTKIYDLLTFVHRFMNVILRTVMLSKF
jgi:hypothetical protein